MVATWRLARRHTLSPDDSDDSICNSRFRETVDLIMKHIPAIAVVTTLRGGKKCFQDNSY